MTSLKEAIRVEICLMENGKWQIRIGDIAGSREFSNMNEKEIIEEIRAEMKAANI